jgi:hypothetical protein
VSTKNFPVLVVLVSPARLTAVTCQVWGPSMTVAGTRIRVAVVWVTGTPSTRTV